MYLERHRQVPRGTARYREAPPRTSRGTAMYLERYRYVPREAPPGTERHRHVPRGTATYLERHRHVPREVPPRTSRGTAMYLEKYRHAPREALPCTSRGTATHLEKYRHIPREAPPRTSRGTATYLERHRHVPREAPPRTSTVLLVVVSGLRKTLTELKLQTQSLTDSRRLLQSLLQTPQFHLRANTTSHNTHCYPTWTTHKPFTCLRSAVLFMVALYNRADHYIFAL